MEFKGRKNFPDSNLRRYVIRKNNDSIRQVNVITRL